MVKNKDNKAAKSLRIDSTVDYISELIVMIYDVYSDSTGLLLSLDRIHTQHFV